MPQLSTTKADFLLSYEGKIDSLALRSAGKVAPNFTLAHTDLIK